jgi:hypothetical protein
MVIMLLRLDNTFNSSKLIRLDKMAHRLHLLIHDISHERCNDECHVKCFSLVLEQMINETVQDITPFCQPPFGVGPSYTTTIVNLPFFAGNVEFPSAGKQHESVVVTMTSYH